MSTKTLPHFVETVEERTCGACGETFPTGAEVFSHDCPRCDPRLHGYVATHQGDSLDAPERHEGEGGGGQKPSRANRYPGPCVKCGHQVEAETGLLVKDNSASRGAAWGVEHRFGQCPEGTPEAAAEAPQVDRPANAATDRQLGFIRTLMTERGGDPEAVADELLQLDKRQASAVIETLKAAPRGEVPEIGGEAVPAAAPAPTQERFAGKTFPNKFAGECRHCGGSVEAQAGTVGKVDGRWLVEHAAGDCETDTELPDVPEGRYAIESRGGNDLMFVRVDRPAEGRWAGRVFVRLLIGGDVAQNIPKDQVADVLQRILDAGPLEAMKRFGQEMGHCGHCGRSLTDEESRRLGIGPVCLAKHGGA